MVDADLAAVQNDNGNRDGSAVVLPLAAHSPAPLPGGTQ
jgi:hypothetical protein